MTSSRHERFKKAPSGYVQLGAFLFAPLANIGTNRFSLLSSGGPILCLMPRLLDETDFTTLPNYQRNYRVNDPVVTMVEGELTHGLIVAQGIETDRVIVATASGSHSRYVSDVRPGNTQVVVAWLELLNNAVLDEIAKERATHTEYLVQTYQIVAA